MSSLFENKILYMTDGKQNNVAMHLQVPPQNTPLLWQLDSHQHISSIPELLRCCTVGGDFELIVCTGFQTTRKVSFFIG